MDKFAKLLADVTVGMTVNIFPPKRPSTNNFGSELSCSTSSYRGIRESSVTLSPVSQKSREDKIRAVLNVTGGSQEQEQQLSDMMHLMLYMKVHQDVLRAKMPERKVTDLVNIGYLLSKSFRHNAFTNPLIVPGTEPVFSKPFLALKGAFLDHLQKDIGIYSLPILELPVVILKSPDIVDFFYGKIEDAMNTLYNFVSPYVPHIDADQALPVAKAIAITTGVVGVGLAAHSKPGRKLFSKAKIKAYQVSHNVKKWWLGANYDQRPAQYGQQPPPY